MHTIPIDYLINHLPKLNASNEEKYKLITGQTTNIKYSDIKLSDQALARCYDNNNMFIGIAKYDETNDIFLPHKMFLQATK